MQILTGTVNDDFMTRNLCEFYDRRDSKLTVPVQNSAFSTMLGLMTLSRHKNVRRFVQNTKRILGEKVDEVDIVNFPLAVLANLHIIPGHPFFKVAGDLALESQTF